MALDVIDSVLNEVVIPDRTATSREDIGGAKRERELFLDAVDADSIEDILSI